MIFDETYALLTNLTTGLAIAGWERLNENKIRLITESNRLFVVLQANEKYFIECKSGANSTLAMRENLFTDLTIKSRSKIIDYWYRPDNLELVLVTKCGHEFVLQSDIHYKIHLRRVDVKVKVDRSKLFGKTGDIRIGNKIL